MKDHYTHAFTELQIPHQRNCNSISFPSVLSPNPTNVPFSLSLLTKTIATQKQFLDSLLHRAGAVLFRGFDFKTAKDFNDFVEAFGYEELPYMGGAAPRTNVVGRLPEFPSKLFFFCEVEPGSGGQTPLVLSHIVYERMKQRYPEFVEHLEQHGLIYTLVLGENDDLSSPIGRSWKSTFSTDDKNLAEERAAKLGTKLEWMKDGGVKTTIGPIPAIKYDKLRQRKIWFNSMVPAYIGWKSEQNDPVGVTFGDGKPLPADIIYDCLKIMEEECVAIPWQKGDVLLIDNLAVLHARRSSNPPRRILASLCK
ncbi:hypothetical protein Pint_29597 [Pistacia integerrima]|uniref:Uncharacterized protein n=1 Tax=Pistacia integerrima TaxID=434235 RepID=A0ACC0X0Z7_9ROSI|nr:hypothetical protein Pint_29597 [Pistacia integerrima]